MRRLSPDTNAAAVYFPGRECLKLPSKKHGRARESSCSANLYRLNRSDNPVDSPAGREQASTYFRS